MCLRTIYCEGIHDPMIQIEMAFFFEFFSLEELEGQCRNVSMTAKEYQALKRGTRFERFQNAQNSLPWEEYIHAKTCKKVQTAFLSPQTQTDLAVIFSPQEFLHVSNDNDSFTQAYSIRIKTWQAHVWHCMHTHVDMRVCARRAGRSCMTISPRLMMAAV
jgi:hypothetical protein